MLVVDKDQSKWEHVENNIKKHDNAQQTMTTITDGTLNLHDKKLKEVNTLNQEEKCAQLPCFDDEPMAGVDLL